MVKLDRAFRDRIDRIADAEMLETEMRSLERLLWSVGNVPHLRGTSAKTACIRDRLRALAEEEITEELDR
jgi:hypothetical protein